MTDEQIRILAQTVAYQMTKAADDAQDAWAGQGLADLGITHAEQACFPDDLVDKLNEEIMYEFFKSYGNSKAMARALHYSRSISH